MQFVHWYSHCKVVVCLTCDASPMRFYHFECLKNDHINYRKKIFAALYAQFINDINRFAISYNAFRNLIFPELLQFEYLVS